jgi:hypothetical protein
MVGPSDPTMAGSVFHDELWRSTLGPPYAIQGLTGTLRPSEYTIGPSMYHAGPFEHTTGPSVYHIRTSGMGYAE